MDGGQNRPETPGNPSEMGKVEAKPDLEKLKEKTEGGILGESIARMIKKNPDRVIDGEVYDDGSKIVIDSFDGKLHYEYEPENSWVAQELLTKCRGQEFVILPDNEVGLEIIPHVKK